MPLDPKTLDHQRILADERDGKLDPSFVPLIRDWRASGQFEPPINAAAAGPQIPGPPGAGGPHPPASARGAGSFDPSGPMALVDKYVTPETVAFGANMLGMGGGPQGAAIGAGTSILKDLYKGNRNPVSIGTHAALHGAVNAIPGMAAERGLGGTVLHLGDMATGGAASKALAFAGPRVGMAIKALLHGENATMMKSAGGEAMPMADELAGHVLDSGNKLLSAAGRTELIKKAFELKKTGAPPMVLERLENLIDEIGERLPSTSATNPGQLLQQLGMAVKKVAPHESLANVIRAITSLGSVFGPGGDLTGQGTMGQTSDQGVSPPPDKKP